jgi:hypothetical protein
MVEQMANLALKMADDGYIMSPRRIAMEGFAKEIAETLPLGGEGRVGVMFLKIFVQRLG